MCYTKSLKAVAFNQRIIRINIDRIICPDYIEDKLASKHAVTVRETIQVLRSQPRIRFAEKGNLPGDDVYAAFGQTQSGRYLAVFFVYKRETATAIIAHARDMSLKERKQYGRNNISSVSKASTLEDIGEFWDKHDFTDFDDSAAPDIEFTISSTVVIEPEIYSAVIKQAERRGVSVETLINLWLQEKLMQLSQTAKASV